MQQLKWISKGIREIHHIRPGLMWVVIAQSITKSISPFVNIYMSAIILNTIVAREPIQILI